jgi:hypothetical protein
LGAFGADANEAHYYCYGQKACVKRGTCKFDFSEESILFFTLKLIELFNFGIPLRKLLGYASDNFNLVSRHETVLDTFPVALNLDQ